MITQFPISLTEFQEKRYEIAREILANIITHEKMTHMTERKQRESMVYGCIQLSDVLMEGLGYVGQDIHENADGSKMTNIADLMKALKKTEE